MKSLPVRRLVAGLLSLSAAFAAFGGPKPRPDRIKVLVQWTDARAARVPVTAASVGGEDVADYDGARLIAIPETALRGLNERLQAQGLHASRRDDFDVLALPGGRIDVRRGLDPALPAYGYGSGQRGLHVVQFIGPVKSEWMEALAAAGAKVIGALSANGQLIIATPEAAAQLDALAFVQWVSAYHPRHKAGPERVAGKPVPMTVEIADAEGSDEAIRKVLDNDSSALRQAGYAGRLSFTAKLSAHAVEQLLADGYVLAVTPVAEVRLSDERQVMATTNNIDATRSQPINPLGYASWLQNNCSFLCGSLPRIGIADTGVDSGPGGVRHLDLRHANGTGDRIDYGARLVTGSNHGDFYGHGTMVAGIIAGNGGTGVRDNDGTGFLAGQGMLPEVRVFSTKVTNDAVTAFAANEVYAAAFDATSNGVFIQNHSHNETAFEGRYSARSAEYDTAVRDSNGFQTAGGVPITLTVSSGNRDAWAGVGGPLVLPAGTGKNVISAGGAENYRTDPDELAGCDPRNTAGGFMFLHAYAKRGTAINNQAGDGNIYPWSTYIKPDVTAVTSRISSARSPTFAPYCITNLNGHPYILESGTSFAAPIAASAAAIAHRVHKQWTLSLNSTPASPALQKAMVIAAARDMQGATDRATGATIGPRPNDQQGFGMVSTVELLDAVGKTFVNQTHRFTTSSAYPGFRQILYRRDMAKPVKAALAWTDAPAGHLDPEPLKNNLDLVVDIPSQTFNGVGNPLKPCSISYWGNNPTGSETTFQIHCMMMFMGVGHDFRNNAELVVTNGPSRPVVTVTVTPTQIGAQANPAVAGNNQDFALYVYNATQRGDIWQYGTPSIIWRHSVNTQPVAWYGINPASGSVNLPSLAQPWKIEAMGDFDGNGSDDFVIRNPNTAEVQIRRMSKHLLVGDVSVGFLPSTSWEVSGAGDIDHDGHMDIIVRNYGTTGPDLGIVRMWRMQGTTKYGEVNHSSPVYDPNWRLEGVADTNLDGNPDFIWHHLTTGSGVVWVQQGMTMTTSYNTTAVPATAWRMGGFADFNGDGYLDYLWRNITNGTGVVWYGDGKGNFPTSASTGTMADLNWSMAGPR